jgi:lysophospholipase L1-like esterase
MAFALGLIAGLAVRPYVASGIRALAPAQKPPMPLDPAHWNARASEFEELDKAERPAVVFLGDSITENLNIDEFLSVAGGRIVNRGIAGDTTHGVLTRIRASFPRQAAVCFLLIGYNDLRRGGTPAETADAVNAIVDRLLRDKLAAHVVVESIPSGHVESLSVVANFNERLAQLAANRPGVSFLDLWLKFGTPDGSRDRTLFVDDVHLTGAGAIRRMSAVLDHLELLRRKGLADVQAELRVGTRTAYSDR